MFTYPAKIALVPSEFTPIQLAWKKIEKFNENQAKWSRYLAQEASGLNYNHIMANSIEYI